MKFIKTPMRPPSFEVEVRVGTKPRNKRERVADWIRNFATLIDGRTSLAVDIQSTPALSESQKAECLYFGAQAIEKAALIIVKAEVCEVEMMRVKPLLFEQNFL